MIRLNEQGIDTDIFWIGKKPLSGCVACKACVKGNKCVFDDSVNEFLESAGDYDGFVYADADHHFEILEYGTRCNPGTGKTGPGGDAGNAGARKQYGILPAL